MRKAIVIPSKARKLPNISCAIVLAGLLLLNSLTYSQQSVYDIIKIDSCTDITLVEEAKLYVGDDLFSLINGGAELYHEYGFVEVLACKMSTPEGEVVKTEIYDMGSPESAWGIFSITSTGNAVPFDVGAAGRSGEGFSQFIKGRYMVYMHYSSTETFDIQKLAGCLSQNIEHSTPRPDLMNIVESGKAETTKLIYFKGQLALSNVYSFHYKDVFAYNEGAAAIYSDLKVILLNYTDEFACLEKYNAARDFFLNSSKYHAQVSLRDSFHMKDRKEQQIDCYFENSFLIIFISSGEEDLNYMRESIVDNMNLPVTGGR